MFCQSCGTQMNGNARFCNNCGAAGNGDGRVGYSPVADTPEFRQLAGKAMRKKSNRLKRDITFACVFTALFVTGVWIVGGGYFTFRERLAATAVWGGIGVVLWFIGWRRYASKSGPSVEMTAVKHEEGAGYYGDGEIHVKTFAVVFEDAAGRTKSYGSPDKRFWEYYQIGDRCLFHSDIEFFEKYDKSRDMFSLCPFCTLKVELGNTRCTHCHKPLLI